VNVRATRKDGRYKVKEEYNAYRVSLCALSLTLSIAHVLCVSKAQMFLLPCLLQFCMFPNYRRLALVVTSIKV
jgi:hypothetical protein